MNKRTIPMWATAVLGAAGCVGAWTSMASAAPTKPPQGSTIVVTAKSDKTVTVAVAGDTTGTGNQVVFSETLWQNTTQVGSDNGVCTQTPDPDGTHYTCDVDFVLF